MKRFFLSLLLLVFVAGSAVAQDELLRLPSAVGDNMVLQHSATVNVWGWAKAGAKVTVQPSWDASAKPLTVKADKEGKWIAELQTPAATFTPQTIVIKSGKETKEVKNILLGEVWICSGQSNMQFMVKQTTDLKKDLKKPMNDAIRLYNTKRVYKDTEQDDVAAYWAVCNAKDLADFSAVGYGFGKILQEELNIPVGLMCVSYGGTFIEGWLKKSVIDADPRLVADAAKITHKSWKGKESQLYNANIYPIRHTTVAGVIWYQGCANVASSPRTYNHSLEVLVNSWREEFRNPEMPFYVVQLVPHTYSGIKGAQLRESQAKATNKLAHCELVVTNDQQDIPGDIHPRNKAVVAARLAACALGEHYGKNVGEFRSPSFASMSVDGAKVTVTFNNLPSVLKVNGDKLIGFQLGEQEGDNAKKLRFALADAEISADGKSVVLSSSEIAAPVAVRYCFDESIGTLFSAEGLPVAPFRSDKTSSKSARAYMDEPSQIAIAFTGEGYTKEIFTKGSHMWPNLKQVLSDVYPQQFEGFEMLVTNSIKDKPTAGGKITAKADGRVYCIVRTTKDMLKVCYKTPWRILIPSELRAQKPDGGLIGAQYIAYRDVRAGDVVDLPSVKDHYSVFVLAKSIDYTPTAAAVTE